MTDYEAILDKVKQDYATFTLWKDKNDNYFLASIPNKRLWRMCHDPQRPTEEQFWFETSECANIPLDPFSFYKKFFEK